MQPSDFDGNTTILKFIAGNTVLGVCLLLPAEAILPAFFSCCVFWCLLPFPSLFRSFILVEIITAQVEDQAGEHSS